MVKARDTRGNEASFSFVVRVGEKQRETSRKSELWVLAVGISDYADPKLALRFAGDDARAFAKQLEH